MAGEKGATYANDLLKLVFQSTALSWNAASNLYFSLHTADPTASGTQTSSESAYGGYARVAATRSGSAAFTVTTNSMTLTAAISFPTCTSLTSTVTYVGIGISSTGAGELLYAGPLAPNIAVSTGIVPQLATATIVTEV